MDRFWLKHYPAGVPHDVDLSQYSSLVLGSAEHPGQPAYVTAAEIAALDLGAELTVLSACETALGREIAGEGLYGLPLAFAVAGSRRTAMTLWPVADEPTSSFVTLWFRRIVAGEAPAAALAATKRDFIAHPRWAAPFYWAPFVLYGAS